jgi:2-amino-4-hydroxy-6-hydroxymethyldihydropteridine diphosphokinase
VTAPVLPGWAIVGEKRRAHIARVTGLLDEWALRMRLDAAEAQEWHDVGRWHDALRDGTPDVLRPLVGDPDMPDGLLHGPAAAVRLVRDGETRASVLDAVRWHTTGSPRWGRTGRALFMADFLEPGRRFMGAERAFLAAQFPHDFDGVFRQVVRLRIEWTLREGNRIFPATVELWNSIR